MTKRYCDVCGKDMTGCGTYNAFRIEIESLFSSSRSRVYEDVCLDCAKKIEEFATSLKNGSNFPNNGNSD